MHIIFKKSILACVLGPALQGLWMCPATAAAPASGAPAVKTAQPTVVLVHGAWADGSGWEKVVALLLDSGVNVAVVQNPLTSLADDVAATRRVLDSQSGPVVLVGHSWGGVVIGEAGVHDKVKALVYVAAFAPAEGESVNDLLAVKDIPQPPGLAAIRPDSAGYLWLSPEGMAHDFAQDVPLAKARLLAVTQVPINSPSFGQKSAAAAWRAKPTWYLMTNQDRMLPPAAQQHFAKRMNAKVTAIDASHAPMLSKPAEVVAVILDAVRRVGQ
ncbi:alpha/beta hydrolase [uncultured Ramlibacter sp.]|uniref:alpha/beta fold hydrolase n=1 Tax=uncultured Ramlibacter sp. TaxID=260755 RepID=UPI00260BCA4C|nr:alpha/beta hydrolase [uncultured Ramlibacter sp.]